MKFAYHLTSALLFFGAAGTAGCGSSSATSSHANPPDAAVVIDAAGSPDISGYWMAELWAGDAGAVGAPQFLILSQTGDSVTGALVTAPDLPLFTGTLVDGKLTLDARSDGGAMPSITDISVGRYMLTGVFSVPSTADQVPNGITLAQWVAHRMYQPRVTNGQLDPSSINLVTEDNYVDPSQPPANADPTTGVAHLAAASGSRLDMHLPFTPGAQGERGQSCSSGGSSVPCPTQGAQRQGTYMCTTQTWGQAEVRDLASRVALVDDPAIYPGSVLQGRDFGAGTYTPVNVPRSGGELHLTGLNLKTNHYSTTVTEMTAAKVHDGIASIIGDYSNVLGTTASISLDLQTAYSSKQLAFNFGLAGSYDGASLSTTFSLDQKTSKNTVVLKFTQVFYTVSYDPPAGEPYVFFRDGANFMDPQNTIGAGNPPLYVASVNYGRQVLFAMTADQSSEDIKATLQGAYNGASASVTLDSGLTYQDVAKSAQVAYVVRGGDAGLAVQPIDAASPDAMFDKIKELLGNAKAARFGASNPAAPVAYTLKYVQDRSTAKMAYSVVYDQNDCRFLAAQAYNVVFYADSVDDDLYLWKDLAQNGGSLIGYTNTPYLGAINLTAQIGPQGTNEFEYKLGNGRCYSSSAHIVITADGVTKLEKWLNHNWWCSCGWQWDVHFTVNKNTGEVIPTYEWVGG